MKTLGDFIAKEYRSLMCKTRKITPVSICRMDCKEASKKAGDQLSES